MFIFSVFLKGERTMESMMFVSLVVTTYFGTCHSSFNNKTKNDDRFKFPHISNVNYREHVTVNTLFLC